ncbi:MAG TPA: hemerythrin domain-containing protein [Actinomycetes bacterium]|nr:hemerythrin domain-containing protein [Actinomycetes bacterium]
MTTKVKDEVTVEVPVNLAYNQWTQFEEFPRFMDGVVSVDQVTDSRLHWVAEVAGVRREWDAEILEQLPDRKVAWAATEGATNAGAVYFESVDPGRTLVRLELEYEPEGLVEKAGDALGLVKRQAKEDLSRFKSFIESLDVPTGAWRGDVRPGAAVGTPGTAEAASSRGDAGKAGVSPTVVAGAAVAGAAAVATGFAATRSGGDREGTESARDVVDVLTSDHAEITALLAVISNEADPQRARDLADTVVAELVRHSVSEEMHVYPAMRKHLPDGDKAVEHDIEEHKEIESLLKELEKADAAGSDFRDVVRRLTDVLDDHVADEEQEQFPQLRARIPAAELVEIGAKVERAQRLAPTRPHPNAPNAKPFHLLVGPGVGLVDRLRDRLTGRAENT